MHFVKSLVREKLKNVFIIKSGIKSFTNYIEFFNNKLWL